ncbi:MAG TPA: hypothetical protein PLN69_03940 [bacterium]|nr:hypothetical protein [bacterium]
MQKSEKLVQPMLLCIQELENLKSQARPILEKISMGEIGEGFVHDIRGFLSNFDKIKSVFENLPLENGEPAVQISEKERKEALEIMPQLISCLEEVVEVHRIMIEALKTNIQQSSDRMHVIGKAKNIFDKFVKAPKQDPKFFDRKG